MRLGKHVRSVRFFMLALVVLATAAGVSLGISTLTGNSANPRELLAHVLASVSINTPAKAADQDEQSAAAPAGSPTARLIFGRGDLPLLFPQRRDSIFMLDPVSGPLELSNRKDFEPSWSPDGSKIVFISLRDGPSPSNYFERQRHREIYTMNRDGTDQRRLGGSFFGGESQPSFSFHATPNLQRIVYTADYSPGGGPIGIYSMNTGGSDHQLLVEDVESSCFPKEEPKGAAKAKPVRKPGQAFPGMYGGIDTPNYSPDNQYIIFGYYGDNGINVYRMDADGSDCSMLYESEGSYYPTEARYSPDGTKIALFHREDTFTAD